MTARKVPSPRRRRRSGGNAMLEWALVILPTLGIITSFFDVSFALFSWTTLQNAVREGVRYAITFQTSGGLGQDASIAQVVATNSMGLLSSSSTLIQVNYYLPTAPNTAIAVGASPAGNVPGNIVEVSVQAYPLKWLVPISGTCCNGTSPYRSQSPANINVYSSDILGGFPAGLSSVAR